MGQIIKLENNQLQIKTAVDLEKEKKPEIGFVYWDDYNKLIFRIVKFVEGYPGTVEYENYDFASKTWIKSRNHRSIKNYKRLIFENGEFDLDKITDYATRLMNGEDIGHEFSSDFEFTNQIDIASADSTALVSTERNTDSLLAYNDKLAIAKNKMDVIQKVTQSIMEQKKDEIERYIKKMENTISLFRKEMEKVMRVIEILEIYIGQNEEVFQITSGEASTSEILNIRQLTLYMDEEMANYKTFYTNGGADYKDIETFDEWLTNPKNRDRVIPEEKCIVFFKPRRYNKEYSSNSYENALLNQWNHTTYVLMRNGDNLYRIYSEHISCSGLIFPKQAELQKLMDQLSANSDMKYTREMTKDKLEDMNFRATRIAVLINSICERLNIFGKQYNMFKMDETGIEIIYDGDESRLVNDGRPRFRDWLREINSKITEGSRICFVSATRSKYTDRSRFMRYYENDFMIPSFPDEGIYTVEEVENKWKRDKDKSLAIRYMPSDRYRYDERKNKVVFMIDVYDDLCINYDEISEDDLQYYLENRIDRVNYLTVLPVLYELKNRLAEERESEKDFVRMIAGQENVTEQQVWDCLYWWKNKNKWKRALTVDDAKAYRMICKRLRKQKDEEVISL